MEGRIKRGREGERGRESERGREGGWREGSRGGGKERGEGRRERRSDREGRWERESEGVEMKHEKKRDDSLSRPLIGAVLSSFGLNFYTNSKH